jgi:uncharacterized metal-binding protein YceD (DUF177 family)
MRVRVDELPTEGLRVALEMDQRWAVQAVSEAFEAEVRGLGGSLRILPVGERGVSVHGQAEATLALSCDRCLSPVLARLGGEVDLYFDGERLEGDREIGLHQDELDVGFIHEGELDLGAALSEFFLLEAPSRLRCDDPGVERSEPGECALPAESLLQPEIDPRLAALKNFQVD